jgi:hypothetical protein
VVADQKKGPDDQENIGTKDTMNMELGGNSLLRLKFCSFDDPGAMPCPLRKVLVDALLGGG